MTPTVRAPLGAALALLLALVSLVGPLAPGAMLAATIAIVVLTAIGWPSLLELDSPLGTRIVMILAGTTSAVLGLLAPGALSSTESIAAACALGIFGSFAHQMLRRERTGLTASLTGTVAGSVLTALAGCWVRAQMDATQLDATQLDATQLDATHLGTGPSLVTAGALGLAVALLLLTLPLRGTAAVPLAILGAAVTTAAVATAVAGLSALSPVPALLVGAAIGLGGASSHALLGSALAARRSVPALAVGAAPVATAGVIVLLGLRVLAHLLG